MFDVVYHPQVIAVDIPKPPIVWKTKIRRAIEDRLITRPDFYGKPLRRSLKGYRKLRVGDYRVIFRIEDSTIKILMIEHRSVVYRLITKRV
ncbi:MAG: type II toxin-antitoxin system RelE family toxin [Candidatus Saccharimonadales bacterium]